MSKYTTELRFVIASLAGYDEPPKESETTDIIEKARPILFNFEYPSSYLTEDEKIQLEKHIILHYMYNEIGFETIGQFKNRLRSKMWDIMPRYNELYRTNHLDFEIFNDVYSHTKSHGETTNANSNVKSGSETSKGSSKGESTNTGDTINLSSDTPQSAVDISSNDYVSAISKNIDNTKNNSSSSSENSHVYNNVMDRADGSSVSDFETTTTSSNGGNIEKLMKYRDSILNIEYDIIRDLRKLFMIIY